MIVLHLENNAVTRDSLERALKVREGRIGQHDYFCTGVAAAAREKLKQGDVKVLVLDLGLNVSWDNEHMTRVLRHLALGEPLPDPDSPKTCEAHGIALLAHQQRTPCALLTNYADYGKGNPPLTAERLCDAFRAQAIFAKDEAGIRDCALWVRGKI